jgi:hypothetical protein
MSIPINRNFLQKNVLPLLMMPLVDLLSEGVEEGGAKSTNPNGVIITILTVLDHGTTAALTTRTSTLLCRSECNYYYFLLLLLQALIRLE